MAAYSYTIIQDVRYGWYIEWYRDDWQHDGYGDNAEVCHWFGSHKECVERAKRPPRKGWWVPLKTS